MFLKLNEFLKDLPDKKRHLVLINMDFVWKIYIEESGCELILVLGGKIHSVQVTETYEEIMEMLNK